MKELGSKIRLRGLAWSRQLSARRNIRSKIVKERPVIRALRKLKLTLHQQQEAIARREAGEALAEIGKSDNVSHATISRLASQGSRLRTSACTRAIVGSINR
jgi:hypothetical protein